MIYLTTFFGDNVHYIKNSSNIFLRLRQRKQANLIRWFTHP